MRTSIVIADDDHFFSVGMAIELGKYEDIEITGAAKDGNELISILRHSPPDLILLDLKMPQKSGWEILDIIKVESMPVKVIVISGNDEDTVLLKAVRCGAKGYFIKGCTVEPAEIHKAISTVMSGSFFFNDITNMALLDNRTDRNQLYPSPLTIQFSAIELDIIRYISQEMTTTQIAEITRYKPRSIENLRQGLIHRVGARSAVGLVIYALRHGLIGASLYAA